MAEQSRWQGILELYENGKVSTKGDRRVLQIIESACDLIAKDGYEALDFGALAKKCKVTRPLINHYFGTKNELFLSVVQYVGVEHQKYIIAGLSAQGAASGLLRSYLKANTLWPQDRASHSRVWMHYLALSGFQKEAKKENTRSVDHGAQRIWEILQAGAAQGLWSADQLLEKARTIQLLLTGVVISLVTEERDQLEIQNLNRMLLQRVGDVLEAELD